MNMVGNQNSVLGKRTNVERTSTTPDNGALIQRIICASKDQKDQAKEETVNNEEYDDDTPMMIRLRN
jgi:hypothetical protein